MDQLLDCTRAHLCHDKPLHPNLTDTLVERMAQAQMYHYTALLTYPNVVEGARRTIGTFFADIRDAIVLGAKEHIPFSLFSGHDTTLLPMLLALNQTNFLWPPYAATLFFDVDHTPTGAPSAVEMVYLDEPLRIPACGQRTKCTWQEFEAFVEQMQPLDYDCY